MSPQELSDHLEITRVLNRYFRSMDTKDYALLDSVFAPGAVVRYDTLQGLSSSYEEMIPSFASFNRRFRFLQHMGGQTLIELDGDAAVVHSNLRAVHVQETLEGETHTWVIYGTYSDRLVRTDAGWRIRERHFAGLHTEGQLLPPHLLKEF